MGQDGILSHRSHPSEIRYRVTQRYALTPAVAQTPPGSSDKTRRSDADGYFLHTAPRQRGPALAQVRWQGRRAGVRRFAALGTWPDEPHLSLYTARVWHKSLQQALRVVVLVNRKDPDKPRFIVLALTALELGARTLVAYYQARYQLEFLLRDAKPFTGLTDCQMRDEKALDFHCKASLVPLNLVRVPEVLAAAGAPLQVFLMASWKQRNFNERLLATIIDKLGLEPAFIRNHSCYEEIRTYGAIAA